MSTKVIIDPETIEVDDETGEITLLTPQFMTRYRHDRGRSARFATANKGESMTQQSDAADCDINVIMKKYGPSGQFPQVIGKAMYGDFSEVTDYASMIQRMDELHAEFLQVPAEVRERFKNNPQEFIEWATDPTNLDEVRKAGLAPPAPEIPNAPAAAQPTAPAAQTSTGVNETPSSAPSAQPSRQPG